MSSSASTGPHLHFEAGRVRVADEAGRHDADAARVLGHLVAAERRPPHRPAAPRAVDRPGGPRRAWRSPPPAAACDGRPPRSCRRSPPRTRFLPRQRRRCRRPRAAAIASESSFISMMIGTPRWRSSTSRRRRNAKPLTAEGKVAVRAGKTPAGVDARQLGRRACRHGTRRVGRAVERRIVPPRRARRRPTGARRVEPVRPPRAARARTRPACSRAPARCRRDARNTRGRPRWKKGIRRSC
jgi:hypothetical protein